MSLLVKTAGKTKYIPLYIDNFDYAEQYLNFPYQTGGKPSKSLERKLQREKEKMDRILRSWSNPKNIETHFVWPVHGRISTEFGLRRYINDDYVGQHRGLDIAAPQNTAVKAVASGKVIEIGKYVLLGNAIVLDHGQGLITVYGHLRKITVKNGQNVKQGQVIGKVGRTGRATGPHLHFGVRLNYTPVDPLLFL